MDAVERAREKVESAERVEAWKRREEALDLPCLRGPFQIHVGEDGLVEKIEGRCQDPDAVRRLWHGALDLLRAVKALLPMALDDKGRRGCGSSDNDPVERAWAVVAAVQGWEGEIDAWASGEPDVLSAEREWLAKQTA